MIRIIAGDIRTLEEVVTRYELEPKLKDIYVEGRRDQLFFKWFLEENCIENVLVYEINDIEIHERNKYGLDTSLNKNSRQKIIEIASLIESSIDNSESVLFIADKDFDILMKTVHTNNLIIFTDFANLEMYFYEAKSLNKFLIHYLRGFARDSKFVLDQLNPMLQTLFLIRLTNQLMVLNLTEYSFRKTCTIENFIIHFDILEYITRYLSKNNRLDIKETFIHEFSKHKNKLTTEPKNQINGQDYINLLRYYIQSCSSSKRRYCENYKVVEGNVFSCAEKDVLLRFNLFRNLITWCSKT